MPKSLLQVLELRNTQHSKRKKGQFPTLTVSASIAFPHFGSFKRKKEEKGGREKKEETENEQEKFQYCSVSSLSLWPLCSLFSLQSIPILHDHSLSESCFITILLTYNPSVFL